MTADGATEGGRRNYDPASRERLPRDLTDLPRPLAFEPDGITRDVLDLVRRRFGNNFGTWSRSGPA